MLLEIRELRNLIGEDATTKLLNAREDGYKNELQTCFRQLMTCPQERVTRETESLIKSFSKGLFFNCIHNLANRAVFSEQKCCHKELSMLFKRLNADFPNDIGCFAIYFLNVLHLEPLQALYLGANEPHAYIYGGVFAHIYIVRLLSTYF